MEATTRSTDGVDDTPASGDGRPLGVEHIVPCTPLDHLCYRGYFNMLFILPFPDPSNIPSAAAYLGSAFESIATQHPFITGFVRLGPDRSLEISYRDDIPFGSRFRVTDLTEKQEEFPHTYEQLKAAGVPPHVWKAELFGRFEKGVSLEKGPQEVMGVQVTFIVGAMVICFQQHHSAMDGAGSNVLIREAFGKGLGRGLAASSLNGLSKKLKSWIVGPVALVDAGIVDFYKSGAVAAAKKIKTIISSITTSNRARNSSIQYDTRSSILSPLLDQLSSAKPDFLPADFKVIPNANRTPLPSQPVISPGRIARPYLSTTPTSAIFVFDTITIRALKSHVQYLINETPSQYLSAPQRKERLAESITSTTIIAALFWTHLTEARATRPGDEYTGPPINTDGNSTFATAVDVRTRTGLPADFIGNAAYFARATLPVTNLISESPVTTTTTFFTASGSFGTGISAPVIARAAIAIAASISNLTPSFLHDTLSWIEDQSVDRKALLNPDYTLDFFNGPDMYCSSWSRFAAGPVNIPGVPAMQRPRQPEFARKLASTNDGAVVILPKVRAEDAWEVQVDARVDDLGRLRAELSRYTMRVVDWEHWALVR